MVKNKKASNILSKRSLILVGSALLVGLVIFVGALGWQGSTKEIESVANQFKPKDSWLLEINHVRPPKVVCLDGGSCPELSRTWLVDTKISKENLQSILQQSKWNFSIEGSCVKPSNIHGKFVNTCSTTGNIEGYKVSIGLSENSSAPDEQRVSLSVRPE